MLMLSWQTKAGSLVSVLVCVYFGCYCIHALYQTQETLYNAAHSQNTIVSAQDGLNLHKARNTREIKLIQNRTLQDHRKYYSVLFYSEGHKLWDDLGKKKESVLDIHLSSNLLAFKNVDLSFEFPYYGHLIKNAILTTGGFIYLGTSKNRHIAGFQYVAPLMAYFNPSLNNSGAAVYYYDNGHEFIVQWSNVHLDDNVEAGRFTFQCRLNKTGEIIFAYQKIAIPVANISSAVHAVKVGISDAYYVDKLKHYLGIWRIYRSFYAYDSVDINVSWVRNGTAVLLHPKPNCISAESCEDCVTRRLTTDFHCVWCSRLSRCSDGFDRHRMEWLNSGCNYSGIVQVKNCLPQKARAVSTTEVIAPWIITVICIFAGILLACGVWLTYAMTHPTSKSGLCCIQHRPRNCCNKSSENEFEDAGPTNSFVFNKVLT